MAEQVIEGTWEEISQQAQGWAESGKRMRLIIPISEEEMMDETGLSAPRGRVSAFQDWVKSHSKDTPLLSDAAVSRESFYGERG